MSAWEKKSSENSVTQGDIHCSHCDLTIFFAEIMEKMPSGTVDCF